MNNNVITVSGLSNTIKNNLSGIYSIHEINQLIYLIYNHLLSYSKIDIHLNADVPVAKDIFQQTESIIRQLKENKPIQYILGRTEFYDLNLLVNHNVLIPRQETEELVDWVIKDNKNNRPAILDIGTGSGCIAIALAKNIHHSGVDAIDNSKEALGVAKENARLNGVSVGFYEYDIIEKDSQPFKGVYNIIISNPPYVRDSEKENMSRNILENEPHQALFVSDDNPLIFYKCVAEFGLNKLSENGSIYLEINENFGDEVINIYRELGYRNIELRKDINGKNRMIKTTRLN